MNEGCRHVVIGAGGFLGSHLTRRLHDSGASVLAVVRPQSTSIREKHGIPTIEADACSEEAMRKILRPGDIVYVLAGQSGAAASFAQPASNLQANCLPMLAALEACSKLAPLPRVVFTGSRLQYGRVRSIPVSEDRPLEPTSPYGVHKTFCEEYLALYARRYGLSYAVARITNPYGAETVDVRRPYNVLDQIVMRAVRREKITVFGDGSQIRDYLHIDDTIDALILLALAPETVVANVGSGVGIRFLDAVKAIVARAGGTIECVPWPDQALEVETGDFVASIARIAELGFAPKITFEAGIERSIEGQRGHLLENLS